MASPQTPPVAKVKSAAKAKASKAKVTPTAVAAASHVRPPAESVVVACRHAVLKILKDAACEVAGVCPAENLLVVNEGKPGDPSDLSSPLCFALAKELKTNPKELAEKVVAQMDGLLPTWVSKTEALNGYVNFYYSNAFFADLLAEVNSTKAGFGTLDVGAGKKVVVEYSDPNVGKPFHVGHIRATILGESMCRLLEANGYSVVRFNYLGDAGAQVAKLLLAMREFKDMPPIKDEKGMFDYYVRINAEIEGKPELKEKERGILTQIEQGDAAVLKDLQFIREKSYEAFQRNYDVLGIHFDDVKGESAFITAGKVAVQECLKAGFAVVEAKKPDGTGGEIVAKLEHKDAKADKPLPGSLPNAILLRSNGTTLYLTRDLGLADYKWRAYQPARSVILTASEQNLHFKQLYTVLRLLGKPYAQPDAGTSGSPTGVLEHIGFGLIVLPEGKMSTRAGKVVFLEDLLNDAVASARNELVERTAGGNEKTERYTPAEMDGISKSVGVGALKFAVLKQSAEKDIVFDFKRMASFEGDTGAYAQYSLVRAKNILARAAGQGLLVPSHPKLSGEWTGAELSLAKLVSRYPKLIEEAGKNLRPHAVCEYVLRLCASFSSFYASTPVLNEADAGVRDARLALVRASEIVLQNALTILGVPVLERM